ncbi:DUF5047 domain-containing protein [uncultured Aeromicrobium sp.]|uniref:DUF5047 domain-containing protein n=1 Tax=uncultured Aeromicrobium sp. TaxID=337820 RepID=UPI0025F7AD45|nr:DUF5047 domain-containing protein [uncultured Aeromicrobium sp.]
MRTASNEYELMLGTGLQVSSVVDIYYGGSLLKAGIPVAGGSVAYDDTQDVSMSSDFRVPRRVSLDGGATLTDLLPREELDPLNYYGQVAQFRYDVRHPSGRIESFSLGQTRIQSWDDEMGEITVTGAGLLLEAKEDRFLYPEQIKRSTPFPAAVRQLLGDIIPVAVDEGLPPRTTPAYTFEEDRLTALRQILDTWPARAYVDEQGVLRITRPYDDLTDPIVRTIRDGIDGTLLEAPRSGSREGRYNAVKASGEDTGDSTPVSGAAYITEGPMAWNSSEFGNVPYFMSSPLLTTRAQCNAAARTRLDNLRRAAEPRTFTIVPDVRLQVGDIVRVDSSDEEPLLLRIQSIDFPLTYDGVMKVTGGTIAGRVA